MLFVYCKPEILNKTKKIRFPLGNSFAKGKMLGASWHPTGPERLVLIPPSTQSQSRNKYSLSYRITRVFFFIFGVI